MPFRKSNDHQIEKLTDRITDLEKIIAAQTEVLGTLKAVVYGAVGLILTAVMGAVLVSIGLG